MGSTIPIAAVGWVPVYLPDEPDPLWLLTIHDPDLDRDIGLLTNRPIHMATEAEAVFVTWRCRPQIERSVTHRGDDDRDSGKEGAAAPAGNGDVARRVPGR